MSIKTGDGQAVLDTIQKFDTRTYPKLAKAQVLILKIQQQGKSVKTGINQTRSRYNERQNRIQNSSLIKAGKTINSWANWLNKKLGISGIPLIPVAVGAAAAFGVAYAVWVYFKGDVSKSYEDYKSISAELPQLEKILADLDKETRSQVEKEVLGVAQQAYSEGKQTDFLGLSKLNNTIFIVLAGLFAAKFIKK